MDRPLSLPPSPPITELLRAVNAGEDGAEARLLERVYDELYRIARSKMRGEAAGHTLQPTALINEAYPRLLGSVNIAWRDRRHFLGAAAEAMRRVLIDHARRKKRVKRGGPDAHRVELTDALAVTEVDAHELIELDAALASLERLDAGRAAVVKLKFFGGLTNAEIAETLDLSLRTVERHWTFSKAWLQKEIANAE